MLLLLSLWIYTYYDILPCYIIYNFLYSLKIVLAKYVYNVRLISWRGGSAFRSLLFLRILTNVSRTGWWPGRISYFPWWRLLRLEGSTTEQFYTRYTCPRRNSNLGLEIFIRNVLVTWKRNGDGEGKKVQRGRKVRDRRRKEKQSYLIIAKFSI